jgi:hypothetical protein
MDIEALRLLITEDELNSLLQEHLPTDAGVRNLRVGLLPEGVQVNGQYTTMLMPIAFETLWELSVTEGHIQARLATVKVAGFPATKLRGVLLSALADNVSQEPGVTIQDEVIRVNLNDLLRSRDVPVRLTPHVIRCARGALVFEGGL